MRDARVWLKVLAIAAAAGCASLPQFAHAQDFGVPTLLPPPPPPPPPPAVYVPEVPVFGEVQQPRNVRPIPKAKPSFSDRAARCLDEAAARGVAPGDRSKYVGACVN